MAMNYARGNADVEDENVSEKEYIKKLFLDVLDKMPSQIPIPEEDIIKSAHRDIMDKFKSFSYMELDFNEPKYLYAYFFAFSSINAAVARDRFILAFNNCAKLKEAINKEDVNIVSLGGGPGTDMVGFLSAMKPYITTTNMSLNLTISDICPNWKKFYNILEQQIHEHNYGYVSSIFKVYQVRSRFIPVDLRSENPPENYCLDLRKADIVLLARVLNILEFEEESGVLMNIVSKMKKGALLLIVDTRTKYRVISDLDILYEDELLDNPYILTNPPEERFGIYPSRQSKCGIAVCRKNKDY